MTDPGRRSSLRLANGEEEGGLASGAMAADWEHHLPQDDLATVVEVAGGREFLEKGFKNTLLSAYEAAAALDLQK